MITNSKRFKVLMIAIAFLLIVIAIPLLSISNEAGFADEDPSTLLQDSILYDRNNHIICFNGYAFALGLSSESYSFELVNLVPGTMAGNTTFSSSLTIEQVVNLITLDLASFTENGVRKYDDIRVSTEYSGACVWQKQLCVRKGANGFYYMRYEKDVGWLHKYAHNAILKYNYTPSNERVWTNEAIDCYNNSRYIAPTETYDGPIYYISYNYLLKAVDLTNTECAISGLKYEPSDTISLVIPDTFNGKTVTQIAAGAFREEAINTVSYMSPSSVRYIGANAFRDNSEGPGFFYIPDSLEEIGDYAVADCGGAALLSSEGNETLRSIGVGAFMNTTLSANSKLPASLEEIKNYAFKNSSFSAIKGLSFLPNNNLRSIGTSAFEGCSDLKRLVISSRVTVMGANAFKNCSGLTIYTEYVSKPSGWNSSWNSSGRPVAWGCTLSSDKSYVVSFNKSASTLSYPDATGGITRPVREGYNFGGWYTNADFTGTSYMDLATAPDGMLYVKWTSNSSCVTEGTMVTLADGTQVAVEELTGNENLLVWNMLTGSFDYAPILFIDHEDYAEYQVITLHFADGTELEVIDEHALWDVALNRYVFMRSDAAQYVGHYFNKQVVGASGALEYTSVELTDVTISTQYTSAWSPVTYGHFCLYVNGMLSIPGGIEGIVNIFEVDPTSMTYDVSAMAADIAAYGLFTYEEFNAILPISEEMFAACNGQYMKVAIGKGMITVEELAGLIARYSAFFA